MKFPFARDLFSPLELSQETLDDIDHKADSVLTETLESATRLLEHEHGLINEHAWKKIRHFDSGVTLYRERKAGSTSTRPRSDTFAGRDKSLFATPPPSFLAVGQVLCSLDDLMFGMSTATAEAQRICSSYVPDGIVDCQLLHHLQQPTPKTPFNYRNLQWLATTAGSVPLTRARDYVVVNEAGLVDSDASGPRIAYNLRHSIQLDDVPPLEQFKIARGAMSICGVFHEVYPSVVHVYMRMTFEPRARGAINKSLATAAAVDYATALARMGQVSQMKKLTTAVRTTERSLKSPSPMEATDDAGSNPLANSYGSNATSVASSMAHHPQRRSPHKRDDACGACCQSMKAPVTPEDVQDATCALCRQTLCRHCRVRKELSFVGRYNRVHRSKYSFCSDCLGHCGDRSASEALIQDLVNEEVDELSKRSPGALLDRSTAMFKGDWHIQEEPDNAYEEWRRRDARMCKLE